MKKNSWLEAIMKPLEEAYSLPFSAYTDASIFQAEQEKIFHSEWIFACAAAELPKTGSYFAFSILKYGVDWYL